jgi:IstB-like ATP binding protein
MRDKVVELIRRFTPLTSPPGDWSHIFAPAGARMTWRQIEDEHRVLILAAPGAGKTFEALAQARRLQRRGKRAFFIRIEALKRRLRRPSRSA